MEESQRNSFLNQINCAGVKYIPRYVEIYRNIISYRHQNDKLWENMHMYTNQNIPLFKIIGTNQSRVLSSNQSKYLVDNDEDIMESLKCFEILIQRGNLEVS